MPTEDDLRAALRSLETAAPDADAVLPRDERRGSARRRTVLLAGAAAVAVVAVPVTVRLSTDRGGPAVDPGVPGPTGPLEFPFTIGPYREFEPLGYRWQPERTQISLHQRFTRHVTVTVYRPGGFDASVLPSEDPVRVHGRPGRYAAGPIGDALSGEPTTGVFWEYAPDAWANARYTGRGDARDEAVRLAETVRFGRFTPLRLPYRLDSLPAGARAVAGSLELVGNDVDEADVGWHSSVNVLVDGRMLQLDAVSIANAQRIDPVLPTVGVPVLRPNPADDVILVDVRYDTFLLSVASPGGGGAQSLPAEVLLELARSATPVPDFADQDTWYEPDTALPL